MATAGTVPVGVVTLLAATWDGANVRLYINGALVSTVANANQSGLTALDEDIRGLDGGKWLNGTLAGAITLRRTASAAEILSLAQAAGLA